MQKKIKLSVLDQSIVRKGATARQAVQETIATAKLAEELGYYRFWVSEHHNSNVIAGSTPEVLIVKLADETQHIRIGSGGIMLPNHSALKVAENFRMLETLFPGRIDLGMGRAPGGDRVTTTLLNPSNDFKEESYLRQLEHLQAYFQDAAATSYGPVLAVPVSDTIPDQWILSSTGGSSHIAAQFGMGLAVARFINGFAQPDVADIYRRNFKPSLHMKEPQVLLAISVLCAENEAKARQLRKQTDYFFLQFEKGVFAPPPDYESIRDYDFSSTELEIIKRNSGRIVSGTKDEVKEKLTQLANDFDVDEIMITTMTHSASDRITSFRLLAEAFEL
ncbi:LLM class flavin-dependent oxidoreductase [Danxiaibacter flavus]|uniref:LLM class flavin-dependent oxidoreductase n=1 Tax=Danxiaibacter flavus TaxID=3049108 RepID=A0ABV3ZAC2_9BACT|nr:LLM class flavin-dependent oxidoreductase [Chitinophagaceae bacterium DXS]